MIGKTKARELLNNPKNRFTVRIDDTAGVTIHDYADGVQRVFDFGTPTNRIRDVDLPEESTSPVRELTHDNHPPRRRLRRNTSCCF